MMADENLRFKREILGVALILSLASVVVLYPFLDAIIIAIATSYLLRFAHDRLDKKLNNEFLSSVIIISSLLGFISLTLYLIVSNTGNIIDGLQIVSTSFRQGVTNIIDFFELSQSFEETALGMVDTFSLEVRSWALNTLSQLPSVFVQVAVFAVSSVFLYRDGDRIQSHIMELIQNLPENERRISKSLIRSIDSIFRGVFVTQFTVAAIAGLIAGLGFYAISLITSPMPLIPVWALLIGVAALLPLVASFLFYGPMGLYYIVSGEPLKGSLVLAYGIIVLNIVPEVFIRPYIGSRQMNEHPLIIFTGFLAGPLTLGVKGLILGPVLLILTKEFILNYTDLVS